MTISQDHEYTDDQNTTTNRDSILEVSNLTKIYPDGTVAVEDISFEIAAGDFCVLIGPSGCGKSTTLHSLVGRFPVTEGEILLDGEEITEAETYKRDIGLVFQDFQLFPHLSVVENIEYGLSQINIKEEERENRIDEMVEVMNLNGMRGRLPEELSAGQKQRVALARSLVLEPKLLLLDEPLGDMDYKLQKRMERELMRIHRNMDTTFVYVTHDQTQAMRLGDQLVVMNDGKIEHSGTTDEVYNYPATAFVSTFVGDSNLFSGELVSISEDGTSANVDTPLGSFRCSIKNLDSPPKSLIGESIPFSVRPQYIEIGDHHENVLSCRVKDVIHQAGSGTQIILDADRPELPPMELQTKSHKRLTIDTDTVDITWKPENATLLEHASVLPDIDLERDILGE